MYSKLHRQLKKTSIKSLFILLKRAQPVVQKTSRKIWRQLFWCLFLFCLFMDIMGGKITISLKELH